MGVGIPPRRDPRIDHLLALTRDNFAADRLAESVMNVLLLAEAKDGLTPVELVDLLERSCTFGPKDLVAVVTVRLGPFAYRGWALLLALRAGREDVARLLLSEGATLLEEPACGRYHRTGSRVASVCRNCLTSQSPAIWDALRERTMGVEVFRPFTGTEQLEGSSFSTLRDVAATADAVARLAREGAFCEDDLLDLCRGSLVAAWDALADPRHHEDYAPEATLALFSELCGMLSPDGAPEPRLAHLLSTALVPEVPPRVAAAIAKAAPAVVLHAVEKGLWPATEVSSLRRLLPHLSAGTEGQNGALLAIFASNGCYDEIDVLATWERTLTSKNLKAATRAAAEAGHSEAATILAAFSVDAGVVAGNDASRQGTHGSRPADDQGLGGLAGLAL